MTTNKDIEEKIAEYRELMKVHQSNMRVVEVIDKPNVRIEIPFLEDYLRTTLHSYGEKKREEGHRAGIDEAVEVMEALKLKQGEAVPFQLIHYNQALDDTIKALQDKK